MSKDRHSRLRLADAESRHSRYIFLPLDDGVHDSLMSAGVLQLGQSQRERLVWADARVGDLVVALASTSSAIAMYACRVSGKGLASVPSRDSDSAPLVLHLDVLGGRTTPSVRPAAVFPQTVFATRSIFEEAWAGCQPLASTPEVTPIWTFVTDGYDIRLLQDAVDDDFVRHVSERHPFGFARSFLTLVARKGSRRVGAILLSPAWPSTPTHRATWRIFREQYVHIREHAVEIQRLYSIAAASRWRVHRALLQAAAEVAPHIARRPLSIMEGVSYDYHPVAIPLGYYVDIPRKEAGSFYYWKPFMLPGTLEPSQVSRSGEPSFEKRLHALLKRRTKVHYWLAWAHDDVLERAVDRGAWALHRNKHNNGRWKLLRPGHVIFLTSHDGRVRASGIVRRTEVRTVEGLEPFPLWIDFKPPLLANIDIDIRSVMNTRWFKDSNHGGLLPLPPEVGGKIASVAEQQKMGGKMLVEPNPYLLHQTQFDVVPKQVFVVQSAALSNTVLPVIKSILEPKGYGVTYWGDRGGQLVFDDVWLLLNESEVVLVDFTEKRPNVYLEYGMALVLGKPVVAITQRKEDIPSDTPGLKYIIYKDKLGDTALRENLTRAIEHTVGDLDRLRSERAVSI